MTRRLKTRSRVFSAFNMAAGRPWAGNEIATTSVYLVLFVLFGNLHIYFQNNFRYKVTASSFLFETITESKHRTVDPL